MHNKVLVDNVIKMELLEKTGLNIQPYFALGNTRFLKHLFCKILRL
jgi:hypothetical protein